MAQTVCVIPSAAELAHLSAIVADRARPLKHIQRVRIVLLSAKRHCVLDVVRLYMDPPRHAVVLSLDEKSQIQALERTHPSQPVTPGRPETQTHDYVRHGTTTLFAALDVLEGT